MSLSILPILSCLPKPDHHLHRLIAFPRIFEHYISLRMRRRDDISTSDPKFAFIIVLGDYDLAYY